jgi:hypothetical protein
MISIRYLLAVGLLTVAHPALSQEGPDIVKIFEQFVTSSAAASRCVKPEQETLNHFLANFQMVTTYASQELEKRYPQRTKEQIMGAMKVQSDAISQKVFELVKQKGCDHADIQEVVKRFYVQAKWQPLKK